MALKWYAARTEPRAEFLAAGELGRDGFELFFPRVKSPHPRHGHSDAPLFPGYLFLRVDPEGDGWPSFRPGHRILGWVSFGEEVPWLPDDFVADLMERLEKISREGGMWWRFQAGQKVRVVEHSIASIAEVVEDAQSPQSRVKVLMEFMGRLVSAQVPWEHLWPVEESKVEADRDLGRIPEDSGKKKEGDGERSQGDRSSSTSRGGSSGGRSGGGGGRGRSKSGAGGGR